MLAYCIYYSSWMCALYFILKVLIDDVLKVENNSIRCLLRTAVIILGILVPFWEFCGDFFVYAYMYLKPYAVILLEYVLSFSPFHKN